MILISGVHIRHIISDKICLILFNVCLLPSSAENVMNSYFKKKVIFKWQINVALYSVEGYFNIAVCYIEF